MMAVATLGIAVNSFSAWMTSGAGLGQTGRAGMAVRAVFVHVARPGFAPTAGCIALAPRDLKMLTRRLGPKTRIVIHN